MSKQLSINFEPGISERNQTLLQCIAAGVYRQGLGHVAVKLDESLSHLSEQLSGGGERNRKFGVDQLERYIEKTGDLSPIHYLVERFCHDPGVRQQEATTRAMSLMAELGPALAEAGLISAKRRRA